MFSRKGANIIAFDKVTDLSFLEDYVNKKSCKFLGFSGNVKGRQVLENMVNKTIERFGKIDILINCAGIGIIDSAENMKEEVWDETMDVNLKAPFVLPQIVGRTMIKNNGGKNN